MKQQLPRAQRPIPRQHRSMRTIHLFLSLSLLLGTIHTHAQPQWRFHLAFEDATGAKDTIWFVYDTTASISIANIELGEDYFPISPTDFNVWIWRTGDNALKLRAWPYTMFPLGEVPISGSNYTPPLTIRWDPSLFQSPALPSTPTSYIRYPGLCGYQILYHGIETWSGTSCYSMFLSDSLVFVAPPLESTLYLNMIFDYDDPTGTGISEHSLPTLDIFPNPTKGRMVLTAPEPLTEVLVLDALGRAVLRVAPPSTGPVELDVSTLPAGSYFVHARGRASMYRGKVVVE